MVSCVSREVHFKKAVNPAVPRRNSAENLDGIKKGERSGKGGGQLIWRKEQTCGEDVSKLLLRFENEAKTSVGKVSAVDRSVGNR